MMKVFADTWYFLALLNPNDPGYLSALEWSRRSLHVVTTEYVILELGNALSPLHWRPRFVDLVRTLRASSGVAVLAASETLLQAGFMLFAERLDKTWSLTDCISFAVMRQHGLQEALTADRHFQQAGYRALLLDS